MIPALAPLIAQAAPVAVDAVAAASSPDMIAAGGGVVGLLTAAGGGAAVWRLLGGIVSEVRAALDRLDARIRAIEQAQAAIQTEQAVAAERDRSARRVIEQLSKTLERDR